MVQPWSNQTLNLLHHPHDWDMVFLRFLYWSWHSNYNCELSSLPQYAHYQSCEHYSSWWPLDGKYPHTDDISPNPNNRHACKRGPAQIATSTTWCANEHDQLFDLNHSQRGLNVRRKEKPKQKCQFDLFWLWQWPPLALTRHVALAFAHQTLIGSSSSTSSPSRQNLVRHGCGSKISQQTMICQALCN